MLLINKKGNQKKKYLISNIEESSDNIEERNNQSSIKIRNPKKNNNINKIVDDHDINDNNNIYINIYNINNNNFNNTNIENNINHINKNNIKKNKENKNKFFKKRTFQNNNYTLISNYLNLCNITNSKILFNEGNIVIKINLKSINKNNKNFEENFFFYRFLYK